MEEALTMFSNFPFILKNQVQKVAVSWWFFPLAYLYVVFFQTFLALTLVVRLGYNDPRLRAVDITIATAVYLSQFHTYYILTFTLKSFLLGLFLNLTYFLLYLAAISVFIFYSYGIWKSLEEKYFLLKLIIYEVCEEKRLGTFDVNGTAQKDEKLEAVVFKRIYDSIRIKLLPYGTSLIWVVLKLFWLFVFSYGVLELVCACFTHSTQLPKWKSWQRRVSALYHIYLIRLRGMRGANPERKHGERNWDWMLNALWKKYNITRQF